MSPAPVRRVGPASVGRRSVVDGVDAGRTVVVGPADSRALAANLLRLLRDDQTMAEFSSNCRREVHERFDIIKQTAQLEAIYSQLLK